MTISAVLCSKNDNPSNLSRVVLTLNNLVKHYDEIVYVDYGSDNEVLTEKLKPYLLKTGKLRTIIVPKSFCESVSTDNSNKFIEVYARNIGIRRATSNFILSTNQDVVSDIPKELNDTTLYTVRRYNFPIGQVEHLLQVENVLEYLKSIKHLLPRQPDSVDSNGQPTWDSGDIWSLVVSCGDYQIAHRNLWYAIKGFEESMTARGYADSNIMRKAVNYNYRTKKLELDIFHLDHHINQSSNYSLNDRIRYVNNFESSTNTDTWGFSDTKFNEVVH